MNLTRLGARSASAVFGIAAFGAVLLAAAETVSRQDSVAAVASAAAFDRFAPPASYFERLAQLDEGNASRWLDAALVSNPRLSSARIARGLAAERDARPSDAARDLRQAARLDRQYLPAWTLANFFYRQNDAASFWLWARRAASLTEDFRPLLKLANAWDPDPELVLSHLGGGAALERVELDHLITRGDADGVETVARALIARHLPADELRLKTVVDWQIRAGRAAYAVELWNALDHASLNPAAGRILTNGDFARAPDSLAPASPAFDWRMPSTPGVVAQWKPSRVLFSFSGAQPELYALLEQTVPIAAHPVRLRFEYSTSGIEAPTGLRWNLDGQDGPMLQPSPDGALSSVELSIPRDSAMTKLARLVLLYRREPGSVRARGTLEVRQVSSENAGSENAHVTNVHPEIAYPEKH